MCTGVLTKAVDMFPSKEIEGRTKFLHDLKEIEELSINEECIIEIEERIANLQNWGFVSGRNSSVDICK